MIINIELSDRSLELLDRRSLNHTEVSNFSALLNEAKEDAEQQRMSAKDILQNMTTEELSLLQKAHSLANPIHVASLSEEGAKNLLAQPDYSDSVDLNNDGIVEVGLAQTIVFPPVNSPQFVKEAWEEATKNMPEMDKITLELTMHIAIYGTGIGDENTNVLSPEEQWSTEGINDLFSLLRGNLEFRVNLEGWTDYNLTLEGVYNRFEEELGKSTHQAFAISTTQQSETEEEVLKPISKETAKLMELVLDARLGIDREKLKEIEDKIKAVENDDSLSNEEKHKLLQSLQFEKEQILHEAQQRMAENEKNKSVESISDSFLMKLNENLRKDQMFSHV
ncbi:MAG: hypothetical protein OCD00_15145 [Colwellia sp.]